MTEAFHGYLQARDSSLAMHFEQCTIDQIRYKPGHSCRLLYRLHFTDAARPTGAQITPLGRQQWLVGHLTANASPKIPSRHGNVGADNSNESGTKGMWRPIDQWPELQMMLAAFPHDPKVGHVRPLLDVATVLPLLQRELAAHGELAPDSRPSAQEQALTISPIKYMPGKRCLLRYDLYGRTDGPVDAAIGIYSKTYATKKSRYLAGMLAQMEHFAATTENAPAVPKLLAHLPELETIWQAAWPGAPLSRQVNQTGWEARLPAVAQALATFHTAKVECIFTEIAPKRGPSVAALLENVQGDVNNIVDFFDEPPPALTAWATCFSQQPVAEHWEPTTWPVTPIHGAFKLGQVLGNPTQLAFVDFDDVAVGDPLYDVAEFVASLLILHLKEALPLSTVQRYARTFLEAYSASVPWSSHESRLGWYCMAFFVAKVHSQLKALQMQQGAEFARAMQLLNETSTLLW